MVPNCVPIDNLSKTELAILEGLIKEFTIKDAFASEDELYNTKEEAEKRALELGCKGAHQMGDKWMPCSTHQEDKYFSDLEDKVRDAIMASLDGVALTQDSLEAQGYVEVEEDVLFDAYSNVKTSQIKSDKEADSIEDFGDFKILYSYALTPTAQRDFCKDLQSFTRRGMLFRREDINNLSIKGVNSRIVTGKHSCIGF